MSTPIITVTKKQVTRQVIEEQEVQAVRPLKLGDWIRVKEKYKTFIAQLVCTAFEEAAFVRPNGYRYMEVIKIPCLGLNSEISEPYISNLLGSVSLSDVEVLTKEEVLAALAKEWVIKATPEPKKIPRLFVRTEYLKDFRVVHPTDKWNTAFVSLTGVKDHRNAYAMETYGTLIDLTKEGYPVRFGFLNCKNLPYVSVMFERAGELYSLFNDGSGYRDSRTEGYTEVNLEPAMKALGVS